MAEQSGEEVIDEKYQTVGDIVGVIIDTDDDVEEQETSTGNDIFTMEQRGEVRNEKDQTINRSHADDDGNNQESNELDGSDDHLRRFINFMQRHPTANMVVALLLLPHSL
uniref:Uncharacterized protein n=1 Tax=Helianthus annuus TaxID=4232 RepID=A0A251TGN4_HELAN